LTQEQKTEYVHLLKQIFSYIDEEAIDSFGLASAWFYHKAGMLNLYKNLAPSSEKQICYIEKYDNRNTEALFYFFAPSNSIASFRINGKEIVPSERKILSHTFLDQIFVYEYRYWVPLDNDGLFSLEIDGSPVKIGFGGKHHRGGVQVKDIKQVFNIVPKYPNKGDIWVVMDRDIQADDNAEHFYRYVKENHPEIECYFALRKGSHDWLRLEKEGFNLLDFGSYRFERILKNCSKIISSHADDYIVDYFKDQGLRNKDFIFLPHGVFQNDLFDWMNSKIHVMSLLVTTTNDEHQSIAGDFNHYKYGNKVVKQLGFPRHDALLKNNRFGTKTILVMPTWRKYLIGSLDAKAGVWQKNPNFMDSIYAERWRAFLVSPELRRLVESYGYTVIFAPHKNAEAYLPEFDLPDYIQIWQAGQSNSIQELFQNADFMITDYSSVAFEMAYLNKLVLYYQFDYAEFFDNQWNRGYFDYEKHGFGPVVSTQEDLLKQIGVVLQNNSRPLAPYKERIEYTFSHRDQNNCKQVFDAVRALDVPRSTQINAELLEILLTEACAAGYVALSEERARKLKEVGDERQRVMAEGILVDILCATDNLHELQVLKNSRLENIDNERAVLMRISELRRQLEDQILRDNAQKNFQIGSLIEAKRLSESISEQRNEDFAFLMLCAVLLDDESLYQKMIRMLEGVGTESTKESLAIVGLLRAMHNRNFSLIEKISAADKQSECGLNSYRLDLNVVLSYFYEKNKDFDAALNYLNLYLDRSEKNIHFYRKAVVYAQKLDNQDMIFKYEQDMFTMFDFKAFSKQELCDYLAYLYKQDERNRFEEVFTYAFQQYPSNDLISLGYRYIMEKPHDDFRKLFFLFSSSYELLLSHENLNIQQVGNYALKKYLIAYEKAKEAKGLQTTQNEWEFYAELGCLGDDIEMVKEAFKATYLVFPEANIRKYLNYFKEMQEFDNL
jgi:CDP-glycerol glycerophosphotransferase (TagB/SpsB family)